MISLLKLKTYELKENLNDQSNESEIAWVTYAKDFCGELISGQSTTGRILMTMVSFLSVGSLIIYFIDAMTL